MAFAEVGGGTQRATIRGTNVDSATAAFPANVTAGSLLLVCGVSWQTASGNTAIAVTDTRGTTYTVLLGAGNANNGGQVREFIAYGLAPSSGANTVTVDPSGTGNYMNAVIDEFSGTSPALDVDGGETQANDSVPADTLTTLTANCLVVGVFAGSGSSFSITPGAAYTQLDEDETTNRNNYAAEFKIATTAGAESVDWVTGSGASYAIYTAAFKETAGGGSNTPRTPTIGSVVLAGIAAGRVMGSILTPVTP